MPRILSSLIQSDFGGDHGNFEAVILEGNSLVHWWRDNTAPDSPWKRGQVIVPSGVAAAGSFIQSDFISGGHGNFEVVVPLWAPDGSIELWHYWHDNSDVTLPWQRGGRIATSAAGAGCIIQSDFMTGDHGNFEVVVPLAASGQTTDLWHFWHDNSDITLPWQRGGRIAANVAGPGVIIQSDFGSTDHGNFEVIVPVHAPDGTRDLWHFWHDNSEVTLPWQRGGRVASGVNGSGVIIQSDFGSTDHGNFEVIVPAGSSLMHFFHDNSDVTLPWQRGQNITDACGGWGSLMRSNYSSGGHNNFEVLVEECSQSVAAYWHPNQDVTLPWMRDQVLLFEPYPSRAASNVRKVVQLTGEYDRQGWNGIGSPPFAFNRTESRFGIRGCDLGSSFEHKNRVYFLFGDSLRVDEPGWEVNFDSIAFCTDTDPSAGLSLTFYKQPPMFPAIGQTAFNVPLDGVSRNGSMYVFFSTDHYVVDGRDLMGRSVIGRSDNDGYDYLYVGEFSRRKFINVSIETGTADGNIAEVLGVQSGSPVLWIFGSGRYRASSVYLAVIALNRIEHVQPVHYFGGGSWSTNEDDASPLFCSADVGELSARWNQFLGRWLVTYNSGNPRGIIMRSAPHPWGPWSSEPVMIFDPGVLSDPGNPCSGAGYGRFMHIPWKVRHCDQVQDDMFGSFRDNDWGAEYGPYQITRYATGSVGHFSQIWFTMSTWNPYQSVLMTATITADMV